MIGKSIFLFLFFLGLTSAKAQIHYNVKFNASYLPYTAKTVMIDPGPNWKGYNLDNRQSGLALSSSNGLKIKNRFYVGVGLAYLNFEGINGLAAYTEFDYFFFKKKKLMPFLNLQIGYSHIWNQYDGGKGTGYTVYAAGLQYDVHQRLSIRVQSGLLFAQQALFVPISIGASILPFVSLHKKPNSASH